MASPAGTVFTWWDHFTLQWLEWSESGKRGTTVDYEICHPNSLRPTLLVSIRGNQQRGSKELE